MIIRFGYVANALGLWDASPSKTVTFARYQQLPKLERLEKLMAVTEQNISNTKRILHYNIAHQITLYRFSSSLVPLATHPEVMWDYITPFKEKWVELGNLVKKYAIRPSFHPNQFTLFTSPKEDITSNAIKDMQYHYSLLEAMDVIDYANINIHIGGAYGNKEETLERFHANFQKLPLPIKKITTLENDDKTYNIEETLIACEKEQIPMVLDYHHFMANQGERELPHYLSRIIRTWENREIVPKVHLSSPKSDQAYRSHADFISLEFILPFLKMMKELNQNFDVMIEAKQKDLAMFNIVEELSKLRGIKRITSSTIEW